MRNWESCDKGTNQRFHGDLFKSRNKYIKITHYIFPLWRPGFCVLLLEEPIQPSCMSPVTLLCTSGTLNKIQINAVETSNIVMSITPYPVHCYVSLWTSFCKLSHAMRGRGEVCTVTVCSGSLSLSISLLVCNVYSRVWLWEVMYFLKA